MRQRRRSSSPGWGDLVVVKPVEAKAAAVSSGSFSTEPQLKRALQNARPPRRSVLIERQIEGDSYRLLYLDGKLLDVIRRPPPMLEGDGVSTIRKGVRLEYERRIAAGHDPAGWKPFDLDLDCLTVLEHGGRDLNSVLAAGWPDSDSDPPRTTPARMRPRPIEER